MERRRVYQLLAAELPLLMLLISCAPAERKSVEIPRIPTLTAVTPESTSTVGVHEAPRSQEYTEVTKMRLIKKPDGMYAVEACAVNALGIRIVFHMYGNDGGRLLAVKYSDRGKPVCIEGDEAPLFDVHQYEAEGQRHYITIEAVPLGENNWNNPATTTVLVNILNGQVYIENSEDLRHLR